jgi:hypothetical protein
MERESGRQSWEVESGLSDLDSGIGALEGSLAR